jgi:GT2 family glycosyltransferase
MVQRVAPLRTTVIVVPRESFTHTIRSLRSLYEAPGATFDLLYVDAGMPRALRRAVERESRRNGFGIVHAGRYATPNQSRNAALRRVQTEFALIVDNDVLFAPNWLSALIDCADETGADLVGPLICIGDPAFRRVHSAGGDASVDGPAGERRFTEGHRFIDRPLTPDLQRGLVREDVGLVEFHCMLLRRSILDRVGPLDERLLSAAEHSDLCMSVRAAGGKIVFEPRAMVNQLLPLPFPHDLASLPFFLHRWSDRRNRASLARLCEKYGIAPDDSGIHNYAAWLADRHRLIFAPLIRPLRATPLLPLYRAARAAKRYVESLRPT